MKWRDFMDYNSDALKEFAIWLGSLTTVVQADVIGQIRALCDLAASGELAFGEALAPIHRDPDLYELRWNFDGTLVRQYHAEPPEHLELLVKLHLHLKIVDGITQELVSELQNEQISYALMRYRAGESQTWSP